VDHVVEARHLALGVADQREVQRGALRLLDVRRPLAVIVTGSTDRPITFTPRFSNSA
jgi:hypothetical protein